FFPHLPAAAQWIVSLAVIWGATLVNLRGAVSVGRVSIVTGAFVIGTFLMLAMVALPHASHVPWGAPGPAGHPLPGRAVGLAIALWNYIGWDNASTIEGEIRDAGRTYPRALAIALPLVTIGYLVPLLATLAATDWRTWTEGGWPQIALAAAGRFGPALA